jgi:predicted molibdopterin-dependent oxidoreductase YjgC
LVLVGADPLSDFPDAELARRALERVDRLIAVDLLVNASAARADVVLAAAGPTEVNGTFTNLEGRVSPLTQKVTPPGTARADWIIAADLAAQLGKRVLTAGTAVERQWRGRRRGRLAARRHAQDVRPRRGRAALAVERRSRAAE